MNRIKELLELIKIKDIVVLTGAGISAESGVKTFRDSNGLWENHTIEDVASPGGFLRDPELVHHFYNLRRTQLAEVTPNRAHLSLAKLEVLAENFTLITQNVDDLHERAGSKNVLHMHGELKKIINMETGDVEHFEGNVLPENYTKVRPDIVWFGESIKYSHEITQALRNCDLYLCIGTSNNVYPASGFVRSAKFVDALCIELNLEETALSNEYDCHVYGKATDVVSEFVDLFNNLR
jgi:NAD-dependent deacetylase